MILCGISQRRAAACARRHITQCYAYSVLSFFLAAFRPGAVRRVTDAAATIPNARPIPMTRSHSLLFYNKRLCPGTRS